MIGRIFRRRSWLVINLGILMCIAAAPAGAFAKTTVQTTIPGGNNGKPIQVDVASAGAAGALDRGHNKGDVWVDNVGQPPGPGHEMDPHLACADINLWGDKLADSSGTYSIDGWPPSGSGHGDQAWSSTWHYSGPGSKVLDVIDVDVLVANAIHNGDVAHPIQGFHFKLQFSQDPQKHKTFWVRCPESTPTPTPTPTATPTPTPAPGEPIISLNKVADRAVANVGDTITYTVTVNNTGTAAATNVQVNDVMSGTASFVVNDGTNGTSNSFAALDTAPHGGVQKISTNHYQWTYTSIPPGHDGIVTYTAKVTSAGSTTTAINGDNQVTDTASIPECCSKTVVTLVPLVVVPTGTPSPTVTPPITGGTAPIPSTGTALNLGLSFMLFAGGLMFIIIGLAMRRQQQRAAY